MGRWFVLVLLAGVASVGCKRSISEDCKTMCEWAEDCDDPEPVESCGENCDASGSEPIPEPEPEFDCVDNCIERMKHADDECKDALGDFADCIDDYEGCTDGKCGIEAMGFLNDCIDEFE